MPEQRHDIHHEFPEYRELIIRLKGSDQHFHKLSEEYARITHEIEKIERGGGNESESYTEDLKKKRVHLKDELFHILRAQA